MKQFFLGIMVLLFGLFIGGIGVATAGIGIGIPMLPIGIYITCRGWRIYKNDKSNQDNKVLSPAPLEKFEETSLGKMGLGIILIIIGIGTSALLIGVPILLYGIFLIYQAYTNKKNKSKNTTLYKPLSVPQFNQQSADEG